MKEDAKRVGGRQQRRLSIYKHVHLRLNPEHMGVKVRLPEKRQSRERIYIQSSS